MSRHLLFGLALAVAAAAAELPDVSLATAPWVLAEGVRLEAGAVSLQGDPAGYRRATLTLPAAVFAGRTLRFSAQVLTQGLTQARDLAYASPKLKVSNASTGAVMAVLNFGTQERSEWTAVAVEVTVPKDHTTPVTLEIGVQFCSGLLRAKDVSLAAVQPWRWRILDGNHKSYFDK